MTHLALWAAGSAGVWEMFQLSIPVLEKILRPVLVYLFLVVLLRIFGKRELAQLNPFDLVVLLSLSNTVQNAIIGDDNSVTGGLVGAFTLCAINYVVIRFLFRHRRLDQLIEGSPTVLIDKGHLKRAALAKELLTESELMTMAHRQGFASLEEIEQCVLEPGGTFFMQGKSPRLEVRHHQRLMEQLDLIRQQLDLIRQQVAPASGPQPPAPEMP